MKRNFEVTTTDGDKYWISRAMCVAVFLFAEHNNQIYVLANKRGEGSPNFPHFWNCPAGYLEWDETIKECCKREVYEETGVEISTSDLHMISLNDNPNEANQNVTFRFTGLTEYVENLSVKNRGGEEDEVEEIKFIPVNDLGQFDWAFNHDNLIKKALQYLEKHNLI